MSYEIRALSFGEILDTGFRLLRNHFVVLVGIGALLYTPLALAGHFVLPASGLVDPVRVGIFAGVALLAGAVLYPIVMAAVTHGVGSAYLGEGASLGRALRVGLSILLPLVGTQLLIVLIQLAAFGVPLAAAVGFAATGLPGAMLVAVPLGCFGVGVLVYLALAFLLAPQVMVLERCFGFSAITRSHDLMRGAKLRGFAIALVAGLFTMVIVAGISLLGLVLPPAAPLLDALARSVGLAYASAALVVFYFDLRCRREAFDLEHLARLVERGGAGAPAPIG